MLNKSVARRYAESFFAIAQEQNKIDEFQNELELVASTVASSAELQGFLAHVLIPPSEKKDILNKLFGGKIAQTTLNFLFVVVDKRRAAYIGVIYNEYKNMADESRNVLMAEFVSAKAVSQDEMAELEKALSAATGKTVRLSLSIDPSLIGGVKVRVGDRVVDASVVKRLDMLKSNLKKVKIS